MRGVVLAILALASGTTLAKPPATPALRRPCDPRGAPYRAAAAELKLIDAAVRTLAPGADPAPLVERIRRVVTGPCYAILDGVDLPRGSGLALKTYWEDGGYEHLETVLDLGSTERYVWTPPSPRRALTLETAPQSPLRALLCPAADERCGVETAGWAMRAERTFRLAAKVEPDGEKTESCIRSAKAARRTQRFTTLRDCLRDASPRQTMLPIGRMRAPREGWLIVTGRRGHYQFCDETRAYHLATGSYYRVGSCSALALQRGGTVDRRATDRQRGMVVELGHVPVDALRESAWMMLLLDQVDRHVCPGGMGIELPAGIDVVIPRDDVTGGWIGSGSFWTSSGHTRLSWTIVAEARKSGTLTYPDDGFSHAGDHAVTLLRIAEEAAVPGCPEVPPPPNLVGHAVPLRAHHLDSDSTSLARAADDIRGAWKEAATRQSACAARGKPAARSPR